MTQWNLIIDVAKCENCNNCVLANKDEYVGNNFPGYSAPQSLHGPSTLRITRHVRGSGHMVDVSYVPRLCNHCDDAPCMKAAGPDVIRRRADGIVIIDPVASKGRKDLVDACPYGAIVWNEEQQVPQNWTFDAHLLDSGWTDPRCAHSCPTEAIKAVKADDAEMSRLIDDQKLEILSPEWGTKPRVHYKNLYRATGYFIGGGIVGKTDGAMECIQGAEVALLFENQAVATAQTDAFGDFKFDALTRAAGQYTVQISHGDFARKTVSAQAGSSVFLGEIELTK